MMVKYCDYGKIDDITIFTELKVNKRAFTQIPLVPLYVLVLLYTPTLRYISVGNIVLYTPFVDHTP